MAEAQIGVSPQTRLLTIAGVAALHLAAIAALIAGFGVETVVATVKSVAAFDVTVPPPPPPPEPPAPVEEPQGKAAPPAARATPKPTPRPPPVIVTPRPAPTATGTSDRSGARESGPGSGGGGQGAGTGSGGSGAGSGGGIARAPEKISGELRTRDFPRSGAGERDGRFIIVRYTVGADGRVSDCRIVQSSGSAEADSITCRLIVRRFRYRPALDAQGNPVARDAGWRQWWWRPA